VLKERDAPGGAAIELMSLATRFALDHGWNVIVEGIMHAERYRDMLGRLRDDHSGPTAFYYFDVSWGETVRRHATRPQAREFGVDEMRMWYCAADWLHFREERLIPETFTLDETVLHILKESFGGEAGKPDTAEVCMPTGTSSDCGGMTG
jgi:hypothetical protein